MKKNLLDLVFPKRCVGCMSEGFYICPQCKEKIVLIKSAFCPACNRLTPNGQYCATCRPKYSITGIIIACHYGEPIKGAIKLLKYEKAFAVSDELLELFIKRLKDHLPQGNKVVTFIPLHPSRQAERGYNQAQILAEKISKALNISCFEFLKKIKATKPQIKLKRKYRLENLKGVFELTGNPSEIKNKTILLVDDVSTTGATLNEAGKTLRVAGAKNIWGIVLAKH